MKNKIILLIITPIFLVADTPWHTITFGILNSAGSATFYGINKHENMYWGVDAEKLSFEASWTDEEYVYNECDSGEWEWCDVAKRSSVSAWLLTPRIGKRFDLKASNKIETYVDAEGYFTFPFVDISIDTGDDDISASDISTAENIIDDLLDFWGFRVAYGVRYIINDQLSLSTSVGYNHVLADFSEDGVALDATMGNTYTKFEINFSF